MADQTFTSLPVEVHRNEEQGFYEFGVTLNGVFVIFAARKLGGIDQDLRRAAASLNPPADTQAPAQPEAPAEQAPAQPEAPAEQAPGL